MGKIRRDNFVFVFWEGDHPPRHVHVYRNGKLLVKWDLEHGTAMKGSASPRVLDLIRRLDDEKKL